MLVIRLQRIGKKHQPSYRVVASEKRSKLGGPPVEDLGHYNPSTKKAVFKNERISHWLGVGAKPTPTVHNLLVKNGVLNSPKMKIHINKPEPGAAAEVVSKPVEISAEATNESQVEAVNESIAEMPSESSTETPAQAEAVVESNVEHSANS
ncbi:MAG: 30S ribosomal protein S16 [Candidatus Liptonbacteria bacterium]|nr:30S ribosomal protein S16 [Candidatus Liptonbacteria bacterium]